MVDRFGTALVIVTGLVGVLVGSALMVMLPALFGVAGYVASHALITASYALLQAASTTGILATTAPDQRGVTSALLGLARNLGLMTGASAMGTVFAAGEQGVFRWVGAGAEAGMQASFAVAVVIAVVALALVLRVQRHLGA